MNLMISAAITLWTSWERFLVEGDIMSVQNYRQSQTALEYEGILVRLDALFLLVQNMLFF